MEGKFPAGGRRGEVSSSGKPLLAEYVPERGRKQGFSSVREISELETVCRLFTKSPTWSALPRLCAAEVLRGAPRGEALRSFSGNCPLPTDMANQRAAGRC